MTSDLTALTKFEMSHFHPHGWWTALLVPIVNNRSIWLLDSVDASLLVRRRLNDDDGRMSCCLMGGEQAERHQPVRASWNQEVLSSPGGGVNPAGRSSSRNFSSAPSNKLTANQGRPSMTGTAGPASLENSNQPWKRQSVTMVIGWGVQGEEVGVQCFVKSVSNGLW